MGSRGQSKKKALRREQRGAKKNNPASFSSLAEEGKLGEALGIDITGRTTKSTEELKNIASKMEGLNVNVDKLRNPDKIAQRIMEAGYQHTYEKAKQDHDWAIRAINSADGKGRNEILGVQKKMFADLTEAKTWHRNWTKIVHPDNNPNNPGAQQAMNHITNLYEGMRRR